MLNPSQAAGAPVRSFSTQSVTVARQLDAWEEVVAELHGNLSFEGSRASGYRGALAARRCTAVQFVAFDGARAASSRSEKQTRSDSVSRYELALATGGELELQHCGHHLRLQPGDAVLVDMSRPHQMLNRQSLSATFIACDRILLDSRLPSVTHACGIRLPRESAALAALAGYAEAVRKNLGQWQDHEFERVMTHLVDLTALVVDGQSDLGACASSAQAALLHRVKQFMHAHLADDQLALSDVAAAIGISTRYMQKLFQIEGGSAREYLLEARLLRARTLLRQRPLRHAVSSIAYMAGFGSASYFSVAYKRRFGVAARDDAKAAVSCEGDAMTRAANTEAPLAGTAATAS